MYKITVSEEIKKACPVFAGAAVYAEVRNTAFCEGLWKEIDAFTNELTSTTGLEDVKLQPVIAATREAYKRCGKDPGRYRPSAEALRRRLMRGISLYRIDTLVDLINLVSLRTGHWESERRASHLKASGAACSILRDFLCIGMPWAASAHLPVTTKELKWGLTPPIFLLSLMAITEQKVCGKPQR